MPRLTKMMSGKKKLTLTALRFQKNYLNTVLAFKLALAWQGDKGGGRSVSDQDVERAMDAIRGSGLFSTEAGELNALAAIESHQKSATSKEGFENVPLKQRYKKEKSILQEKGYLR